MVKNFDDLVLNCSVQVVAHGTKKNLPDSMDAVHIL